MTGPGLASLPSWLARLDLTSSKVTDHGLNYLAALNRLRMLWLNETGITDAGLTHLAGVPSLEELDVSDTAVTDAGLIGLVDHPNLSAAYARRTDVTHDAVRTWLDGERILITESEDEEALTKAQMDQQFADYLFDQTQERFHQLYAADTNPTIGGDIERALRRMLDALGYPLDPNDASSRRVWSLGSAGYVWRLAEEKGTGWAAERIADAVRASFDPRDERYLALAVAAKACLDRRIPLGLESPGGLNYGVEFLEHGFRHVAEAIREPGATVPNDALEAAFYFGVALHDVEPLVDELRGRTAG